MTTALCSIAKLKKHMQTKDKDPYKDFQMPGWQSSRERSLCVLSLSVSEEDAEDPVLAQVPRSCAVQRSSASAAVTSHGKS